ncbi:hypothetical protein HOD61_01980 [archaeon]|jgi:hypothetical protein|nr:hypothetical protein [archaeon]
MNNKKGQSLSMNTIIIAILAILALVIIAAFFTGGMTNIVGKIKSMYGAQPIDTQQAIAECNGFCSNYELIGLEDYKDNFCGEKTYELDTDFDGKIDVTKTCSQLGVTCSAITNEGGC